MGGAQTGNSARTEWRLLLGLLCVALVVFAGTISVAHSHQHHNISHADCSLCVSAHATVQLVSALPAGPALELATRVEAAIPEARPRNLSRFALFTRPPPANAHLTF